MTALSGLRAVRRPVRRPTMADVAAEAHVSIKTVSRVVNRGPGVRPDTAERVRAAIERLGFRTTGPEARSRVHTVGLVVETLAGPFSAQIAAAVERETRLHGYNLITVSAERSAAPDRRLLHDLAARCVDGLIVVPAGEAARTESQVAGSGIPLVYLGRPARGAADAVLSDNQGGVRGAVEHLVAHGHRHIGFLGGAPPRWTARQRRDAFVHTHQALGLPGTPRVAMGPHTRDSLVHALRTWSRPTTSATVTAVIAGDNRVTLLALYALRGLTRPVSLVGYDDIELADLIEPSMTVVHQDPAALGQKAAQQLFSRLRGDRTPPQTFVLPTRLIVRASSRRRPEADQEPGWNPEG
ncbi:LacI family DNA-binding transcriptional regulator [Streptomyces sp. NPDC047097]|uniref:LacI family DNA-binding transcriptional regulator n=1 Tax=Streptomyces sp. NPDC047097 TaxID=3155260 RepID=UPI0033EB20F8